MTTPWIEFANASVVNDFKLTSSTISSLVYTDTNKYTQSITLGSNLSFVPPLLDTIQDISISDSPQFTGLNLSGLTTNRLISIDGSNNIASVSTLTSWISETTNQVEITDNGNGTITLTTPQDIHAGASPTFVMVSITGSTTNPTDVASKSYVDNKIIWNRVGNDITPSATSGILNIDDITSETDTATVTIDINYASTSTLDIKNSTAFQTANLQVDGKLISSEWESVNDIVIDSINDIADSTVTVENSGLNNVVLDVNEKITTNVIDPRSGGSNVEIAGSKLTTSGQFQPVGNSTQYIGDESDNIRYQVDTGQTHDFYIDTTLVGRFTYIP